MTKLRVIVSGGGSGGHVFPAIAIAGAIREIHPDAEFLFVGAKGKMEMEKVPQAGYKIEGLTIAGFHRKQLSRNLLFPFKLLGSLWKAYSIVGKFKPHVAVGTGGYASGPTLRAAQWRGVPTVLQEQNSFPGVTNKLLGKGAARICVAYDKMEKYFPKEKLVLTGNPIRGNITASTCSQEEGVAHFELQKNKPTLFITGGSLGASALNAAIASCLEKVTEAGIQVIWQTGKIYLEKYKHLQSDSVKVLDFVSRMDAAYAAADVIVSRAGGTISELCIIGKPAILLPSPNVAEDHQTKNVAALEDKGAAVLIRDAEAEAKLGDAIISLFNDPARRDTLSKNIKALAKPDAANHIAREVLALV